MNNNKLYPNQKIIKQVTRKRGQFRKYNNNTTQMKTVAFLVLFITLSVAMNGVDLGKYSGRIKEIQEEFGFTETATNEQQQAVPKSKNYQASHKKTGDFGSTYYDFIVVGGGAAGSLVASQLGEIANGNSFKVLVLDKGSDDTDNMDFFPRTDPNIPRANTQSVFDLPVDRRYSLEGPGMSYSREDIFAGKTLGGGFSVSGSGWQVQDDSFYDDVWVGKEGLSANLFNSTSMRQCSTWLENVSDPFSGYSFTNRGDAGPIKVMRLDQNDPTLDLLVPQFLLTFGTSFNEDSGHGQEGLSAFHRNIGHDLNDLRRYSSYTELLQPLESQSNVDVVERATVTKIEFNQNKVARKVRFVKDGISHIARLKRNGKVIVTAGPLISPQILMLSGVGPCDHLDEFNIECVHNNVEVGKNYLDHFEFSFITALIGLPDQSAPIMTAYLKSPGSNEIDTEIAWVVLPTGAGFPAMLTQVIALSQNTTGEIKLQSEDPLADPYFSYNYDLTGPDGDKFVHFVGKVQDWHNTLPFVKVPIQPLSCGLSNPPTIAEITPNTHPYWHSTSSAKIGKVVDEQGKVMGVEGVYVMDSSVLPTLAKTHPAATILTTALKLVGQLRPDNAKC
eukprot:TRINITY_DN368_c0_g1_i1.p1 TRINITY_DN368_c0_g1~~TRINITY_DN368_c0_g1_i1.p1  ORF type:complete len:616 (-),score=127.82 TRINITY_DN368_c0_g1_i1:67-1914(-)